MKLKILTCVAVLLLCELFIGTGSTSAQTTEHEQEVVDSGAAAEERDEVPVNNGVSGGVSGAVVEDEVDSDYDVSIETPVPVEDLAHLEELERELKKLRSSDENTRIEARVELLKIARRSDLSRLVTELKTMANTTGQLAIIETLGQLRDKRASRALREELLRGRGEGQLAAARALGRIGTDWPISALYDALTKSGDFNLQKSAASALGEIGTPNAIYALAESRGPRMFADRSVEWAMAHAQNKIDYDLVSPEVVPAQANVLMYRGTRYYAYVPAVRPKVGKPWMMVCIHDRDLDGQGVFRHCLAYAQKFHTALVVPEFNDLQFPAYDTFNLYGERADRRLFEIVNHVSKVANVESREILWFGIGLGGGMVQRIAMVYPDRVGRGAFDGGVLTALDDQSYFPVGTRPHPAGPDLKVDRFRLARTDLRVIERQSKDTRATLYNQGQRRFFNELHRWAEEQGVICRAKSELVRVSILTDKVSVPEQYLFGDIPRYANALSADGKRRLSSFGDKP